MKTCLALILAACALRPLNAHASEPGAKSSLSCMLVRVRGTLRIGAQREDGSLTCIYRMEADDVAATP